MKFTKMHGLGNDYVYVDCFEEQVDNPSELARILSDRHTGVGCDGLILIRPSATADVRMEMYNADGSRAQMCGNGIRCVAKYAVERRLARASAVPETVRVETDAGVKPCQCHLVDGIVRSVRVDMGPPALSASALPSTIPAERVIDYPLRVAPEARRPSARAGPGSVVRAPDRDVYRVTCVSMGNPHAVAFVDDIDMIALDVVGPLIERAPEFPERINAHFVRVDSPGYVTMMSWERGSGATRACGTGACAVCVAGALTERTQRKIIAALPGGELELEWADNDHVYMTGPAVEVFTGRLPA
jgi:diaminopimelate epimerase